LTPPPDRPPSDLELLARIARGDRESFAALYDRHGGILFGVLLRILANRREAEDALQETFLHLWRRAEDYDESRGRPLVWLTVLARSRALDRLRTIGLRIRTLDPAALEPPPAVESTVDRRVTSENGRLVRSALEGVSEGQREPLLLAYFDGLTQTEIAERLGRPLGTVKTQIRLGLSKLRLLLREAAEARSAS
jgi:RNA polymerase sigma-70 factor, ECF subfamily